MIDLEQPCEPQATFFFEDWNIEAELPDDLFTPEIPKDAVLAAFLPRGE